MGTTALAAGAKLVSIGPETSAAVRREFGGLDAEAATPTLPALVEATVEALRGTDDRPPAFERPRARRGRRAGCRTEGSALVEAEFAIYGGGAHGVPEIRVAPFVTLVEREFEMGDFEAPHPSQWRSPARIRAK